MSVCYLIDCHVFLYSGGFREEKLSQESYAYNYLTAFPEVVVQDRTSQAHPNVVELVGSASVVDLRGGGSAEHKARTGMHQDLRDYEGGWKTY